jgi:hypothetical protein
MVSAASRASPLGTTLSHAQALLRVDFAAGHDDLKRPALTDKAWQAHRASILLAARPSGGRRGALIGVEIQKGLVQCLGMFGIDGIARFGAREDDGDDAIAALDADGHRRLLWK